MACSLHRGTLDGVRRLELRDSNSGKVTVISLSDLLDVKESSKKEKEFYYPFEVCTYSTYSIYCEFLYVNLPKFIFLITAMN